MIPKLLFTLARRSGQARVTAASRDATATGCSVETRSSPRNSFTVEASKEIARLLD